MASEQLRNVLILGCPRSGTSIVGELFEIMPFYRYHFEPAVTRLRVGPPGTGPVAAKNPVTFVPPDDPTEDDSIAARTPGLACDLASVRALLDPVVIWVVRDPVDTVASLGPGLSSGWGHGPRPPWWQEALGWDVTRRAASFWVWINQSGFGAVPDALVVRFEELISDTATTVGRIWDHVGFTSHPELLGQYERMVGDERAYQAAYQDRWADPSASRSRIGRGRRDLPASAVDLVETVTAAAAERFGYR